MDMISNYISCWDFLLDKCFWFSLGLQFWNFFWSLFLSSIFQDDLFVNILFFFYIFEKILVISLQWFAVQQKISTIRDQEFALFHAKFNAKFSASSLVPAIKNHRKSITNCERQTVFGKPIYTLHAD